MVHRLKRRFLRRPALAVVMVASLLMSVLPARAEHTGSVPRWDTPPGAHLLAIPSGGQSASAPALRPVTFARPVIFLHSLQRPLLRVAVLASRQREGSLPPTRRHYRRVVHDSRSCPPA